MGILAAYAVPHPPLIIPSVGRGEERAIQDTIDAYNTVAERIIDHNPDVVVVTSPHAPLYRDAFHITTTDDLAGSMAQFNARKTRLNATICQPLVTALQKALHQQGLAYAPSTWRDTDMDHATFIPLFFIEQAYLRHQNTRAQHVFPARNKQDGVPYPLVRIGLSGLSPEEHRLCGKALAHALDETDMRVVVIASGDLSHKLLASGPYGFAKEGPEFDAAITRIFKQNDLEQLFHLDPTLCNNAAECGLRSFEIMAGALDGIGHTGELLSYEGPFGVGYGVAAFECDTADSETTDTTPDEQLSAASHEHDTIGAPDAGVLHDPSHSYDVPDALDPYIELARHSLTRYITTGSVLAIPADLPHEMRDQKAGIFVSLHKHGDLRGCIGTILPTTDCIAQEIIDNAIAASTRDPRFPAVSAQEIPELEISVDVLHEPERISDPEELDPHRYGVIVTKGWHKGLLLPNLEGVDTVDEQLAIAKRKAGLSPSETKVKLERFEVIRHEYSNDPA